MSVASAQPNAKPSSPRGRWRVQRRSVFIVILITMMTMALTALGALNGSELRATNLAFRLRGERPPTASILIIAIDDYTFGNSELQWPFPRTLFAQVVDTLAAGGARSITFDVLMSEPESANQPATYVFHEDTLKELAAKFNVTETALAEANPPELCAGNTVTLPTQPAQTTVLSGDSVETLAVLYNVPAEAILALNGKTDPCEFRDADILLIPILGPISYTIAAGDTVATVAQKFQINPRALLDADHNPARDPLMPEAQVTVQFGDAALAAAMADAGNVILNGAVETQIVSGQPLLRLNTPLTSLRQAMAAFGITNVGEAPGDGVVHALAAFDKHPAADNTVLYSWPLVTAAYALDPAFELDPRLDVVQTRRTLGLPNNQLIPLNANPSLDGGQMFINFRGGAGTFTTVPLLKVVNGDYATETQGQGYQDKIVLIGATASSLKDVFNSPFDETRQSMPGVEVMANAIDTVLSGEYLARLALWPSLLIIGLAGVSAIALTAWRTISVAIGTLLGLMLLYALVWLGVFVFFRAQWPLVGPELTLVLGFVVPTLERALSEELEKRRVRGIFEMFISPEMVGQLIDQGVEAMRGKRTELTILFSDIRGFTTMSEAMTPEALVEVLNEYLGAMTDVIHKHGGTVDKYEGDLVMAFFGAPISYADHAQRAVRASIEMRQELERLRTKWAGEGKPSRLEMGIGLNTADVFVGLVGSGRRVNYTVMGDGVNLASRLQDLTKDLKWPLLMGEATYEKVKDDFEAEFGDARLVKGKTVPVNIYKVLAEKGAPPEKRVRALYE